MVPIRGGGGGVRVRSRGCVRIRIGRIGSHRQRRRERWELRQRPKRQGRAENIAAEGLKRRAAGRPNLAARRRVCRSRRPHLRPTPPPSRCSLAPRRRWVRQRHEPRLALGARLTDLLTELRELGGGEFGRLVPHGRDGARGCAHHRPRWRRRIFRNVHVRPLRRGRRPRHRALVGAGPAHGRLRRDSTVGRRGANKKSSRLFLDS